MFYHIRFRGLNHYISSRTIASKIFEMQSTAAVHTSCVRRSTSEIILLGGFSANFHFQDIFEKNDRSFY
jgi:hypothetical protein